MQKEEEEASSPMMDQVSGPKLYQISVYRTHNLEPSERHKQQSLFLRLLLLLGRLSKLPIYSLENPFLGGTQTNGQK